MTRDEQGVWTSTAPPLPPDIYQYTFNVDGVSTQIPAFARVADLGDTSVTYEIKYHMADYSERDRIDDVVSPHELDDE